ncbi:hypothetical protein PSJE_22700 [Pseudomonas jessenii]|nr:hypothetical protein PSJE_22700 [Pseudomonas jessenii]
MCTTQIPCGSELARDGVRTNTSDSPPAYHAAVRYHPPNSDTRDRHAPLALPVVFSVRPAG